MKISLLYVANNCYKRNIVKQGTKRRNSSTGNKYMRNRIPLLRFFEAPREENATFRENAISGKMENTFIKSKSAYVTIYFDSP